ncbi:Putative peptidoglycan binding domain-containing protein [Rhodospirillales bacterium URHD0017]|nr:Putative peptidoglycan binding domain-containing protein [Rhodospirillales bacterium URHD0017]
MLGDGTTGSWWRKVWPFGARRDGSPANDAMFIDVMADFSRQLGDRVARQSAGGLAGAAQERREALKAYDRTRRRRQMLTGGVTVGALIALGIASLAPPIAPPVAAPPAVAAAPTEPPPVMVAATQPTALPDTQPTAPASEPAQSSTETPPVLAAPEPLRGEEVREVQKRLQGFGFNPGPADGVAGRMTAAAVMNYQQSRGQPQSGDIDRDLLGQLRQDPAPQVAPPPPVMRTAHRAPRPTRSANPLDHLGRWLDSLVR